MEHGCKKNQASPLTYATKEIIGSVLTEKCRMNSLSVQIISQLKKTTIILIQFNGH